MASSAFSFHCMICFEEFDPQTNYPVVLPCGHTYVCIECANRLDKCMECRTPLTMKMECPPAPPPPVTTPGRSTGSPAIGGGGGVGSGSGQSSSQDGSLKENQANRYADRVRNSPGFRRRYGDSQREDYRNNKRHPQQHQHQSQQQQQQQQHPPPLPIPKQRLPLPKNAVLLSLIQASEPARRRAEVEAPPTPQKVEDNTTSCLNTIQVGSETPSPGNRGGTGGGGGATSSFNTLPKFTRPSPLFLDGSSSGEFETNNNTNTNSHTTTHHHHHHTSSTSSGLVGSQPDDEEHKIRVGTYLEGGPCGTYAVAVKSGLLVYPTLFEHTLPSALNGLTRKNKNNNNTTTNQNNNGDNDEDLMKRNVEELVKQHRARTFTTQQQKEKDLQQQQQQQSEKRKKNHKKKDANNTDIINGEKGETTAPEQESISSPLHHQNDNILENNSTTTNNSSSSTTSPLHTELGISHTWDDENLEVQVASIRPFPSASSTMVLKPKKPQQSPTTLLLYPQDSTSSSCSSGSSSSTVTSPQGTSIIMNDNDNDDTTTTNNNNNGIFGEQGESTTSRCMEKMTAASDPGTGTGGLMSTSALMRLASLSENHDENENDDGDVGLAVSLTISISDEDDTDNNIGDLLANSVRTMPTKRSQSVVGMGEQRRSTSPLSASHRVPTTTSSGNTKDVATKFVRHFSQGYNVNNNNNNNKNGNHHTNKTKKSISDSASSPTNNNNNNNSNGIMDEFERPLIRLKYGDRVQVVSMDSRGWVKLARGYGYIRLENDKQLVKVGGTSDKACQIEAMLHELSLERNRLKHEQMKLERLAAGLMIDLQSSLITSDDHVVVSAPMLRTDSEASLLNIDVSTRSRTALTPPRSMESTSNHQPSINHQHPHREIRTAKSHSPGRTTLPSTKTPPSPPYGQVTPNPTSQNLATINTPTRVNFRTGMSGHRALTSSLSHPHDFIGQGNIRSMSNHSGISSTKKPSSRGRSIY